MVGWPRCSCCLCVHLANSSSTVRAQLGRRFLQEAFFCLGDGELLCPGLYSPLVYLEDQDYIHLVCCHSPTGVSGSPQVPRKYWLDKWLRSEGPLWPAFICLLVLKSLCAHFPLFPPHFGSWEGVVDSWVGTGGGFWGRFLLS